MALNEPGLWPKGKLVLLPKERTWWEALRLLVALQMGMDPLSGLFGFWN